MPEIDDLFAEFDVPLLTAGVDEVGRGPLCGDVVTAAVILDPNNPIAGLNDSKKLTEKRREALYLEIKEKALSFCIARASVAEIDELNILQASLLAMHRAVAGLSVQPSILAKVTRDREMAEFDTVYPGYGMAGHKGYPTKVHLEALKQLGITPIHRRSYAPVRAIVEAES